MIDQVIESSSKNIPDNQKTQEQQNNKIEEQKVIVTTTNNLINPQCEDNKIITVQQKIVETKEEVNETVSKEVIVTQQVIVTEQHVIVQKEEIINNGVVTETKEAVNKEENNKVENIVNIEKKEIVEQKISNIKNEEIKNEEVKQDQLNEVKEKELNNAVNRLDENKDRQNEIKKEEEIKKEMEPDEKAKDNNIKKEDSGAKIIKEDIKNGVEDKKDEIKKDAKNQNEVVDKKDEIKNEDAKIQKEAEVTNENKQPENKLISETKDIVKENKNDKLKEEEIAKQKEKDEQKIKEEMAKQKEIEALKKKEEEELTKQKELEKKKEEEKSKQKELELDKNKNIDKEDKQKLSKKKIKEDESPHKIEDTENQKNKNTKSKSNKGVLSDNEDECKDIISNYDYEEFDEIEDKKASTSPLSPPQQKNQLSQSNPPIPTNESTQQRTPIQAEANDQIPQDTQKNESNQNKKEELSKISEEISKDKNLLNEEEDKPKNLTVEKVKMDNEANANVNENNPDKTIFSKLAEDMYYKIMQNSNNKMLLENNSNDIENSKSNNKFQYNKFIDEEYLKSYSNKISNRNAEKIKDFLERYEEYNKIKKKNESAKPSRQLVIEEASIAGNKKESNFLFKVYNKKKLDEEQLKAFNEIQKDFLDRKNKKIDELKKKQMEKETLEMRDKPKINKWNPKKLYNKSELKKENDVNKIEGDKNLKSNVSKNAASVSYFKNIQSNNLKNKQLNKTPNKKSIYQYSAQNLELKNKKLPKKEIDKIVTKLHNDQKERQNRRDLIISKSCESFLKEVNSIKLVSMESNKIIFTSLINEVDKEILSLTNSKLDKNPLINKEMFHILFFNLKFSNINDPKVNQVLNNVWTLLYFLTNPDKIQEKDNQNSKIYLEKIHIDIILIFIFIIYDLYTAEFIHVIKSNLQWLDIDKFQLSTKNINNIKLKFKELYLNRQGNIKSLKDEQKKSTKNSPIKEKNDHDVRLYTDYNSNKKKSLDKFLKIDKNEHRLKPCENYNIILRKREEELERLRIDQFKRISKECTFNPKINTQSTQSSPSLNQVYDRLYCSDYKTSKSNLQKSKNKILKTEVEIENDNNCTFSPAVNKDFCPKMFTENNGKITNDSNVKTQMQRYQNARVAKNIKDNANSSCYKPCGMKFDNENTGFKNSFDKFYTFSNSLNNSLINSSCNSGKKSNSKNKKHFCNALYYKDKNREPLLTFEIKIRQRYEILNYYYGDNIEDVANKFVKKNNLSAESKKQIISAIENKLTAN